MCTCVLAQYPSIDTDVLSQLDVQHLPIPTPVTIHQAFTEVTTEYESMSRVVKHAKAAQRRQQ